MNQVIRKTLSVVGAGKLGSSLCHLWVENGTLTIQSVCNRSMASAEWAVNFIGGGIPEEGLEQLAKSDIVLIATPDNLISTICDQLVEFHPWIHNATVFHCSGALGSDALSSAITAGAKTASVHPVKSFASPKAVVSSFRGTFCGVEGNPAAIEELQPVFKSIGASFIPISSQHKTLYHCAAVLANNYYVSLIDAAQRIYEKAGIPHDQSMSMLAPMLRETTENLITLGSRQSLTGPIARGDLETVDRHLQSLNELPPEFSVLYKVLGEFSATLADHPDQVDKALRKRLEQ